MIKIRFFAAPIVNFIDKIFFGNMERLTDIMGISERKGGSFFQGVMKENVGFQGSGKTFV